jgi:hypothetical protein
MEPQVINGVAYVDSVLRYLQRQFDDMVWEDPEDPDLIMIEKEISRLTYAQKRGEIYDPVF